MCDKNDGPKCNNKSTPPPSNRKIRNPFDKVLIDKLHKPICSPGMCKVYKKKNTSIFRWEIDQYCKLAPADIVACNSQFEPSPDPVLEKIAEEATEKFFSQEMVMPSPSEWSKKVKPLLHTSCDASIQIDCIKETIISRDAQTVLTLPPELPPEIEKLLQPFCTFTQDQDISGDYEITANGSLRRKLYFDEHSDIEHEHEDSEQTDDEVVERPTSSFETHSPVKFSPDLSLNCASKGMKRTFGTPLKPGTSGCKQYRNKILEVVDFRETSLSPIEFRTPKRNVDSATSSLASASISPVTKTVSSDDEKNNFTSPESEAMAVCLNCIASEGKTRRFSCFCKTTPNKVTLVRSASLKDSPPKSRKGPVTEKRSLSKSAQKLNFNTDMSIDSSFQDHSRADSDFGPTDDNDATWSIIEESTIQDLVKTESFRTQLNKIQSSTKIHSVDLNVLDETPLKSKQRGNLRSHEISKIRDAELSPSHNMSLDSSFIEPDNLLNLEDKKIDFNNVDLKFLTENVSRFEYTVSSTKVTDDVSTSFKRIDSGFNDNTFYASSYYESAIKPSELTVTNISKSNALKEISNVHWARVDSGFKDENSADSVHFYTTENAAKNIPSYFEARLDKENTGDFERYLVQSNKNDDAMSSMSEVFSDDMTFNCNFSSTPSKNKTRKVNS